MSDPATDKMNGLRASAIVFVGVGVANFSNYLFHLISARSLGPSSYSDVATLSAVIGVVILPLAGAQVFVARHVASAAARGRPPNDERYVTAFGGAVAVCGGVLTLVLLAGAPLIASVLSISSLTAVILAILVTTPGFVSPVLVGVAQGRQRFGLFAASIGVPSALRVVFVAAALAAGFGVTGAMGATLAGALVAVVIPFAALRRSLEPVAAWRPRLSRSDAFALAPVVAGTLAITLLTTDDLVAAKVAFTPHVAGLYGAASLIGRAILYLPAAIVTVLLPSVSARVTEQRDTGGLLTRSLIATGALCGAFTVVYAVAPQLIARIAFGSKFEGSASLLWMFGIAMTIYSLLNVVLFYRLGHGETRICWMLLAGAFAQMCVYAVFHASPRELLVASITTGAVLLALAISGLSHLSQASVVSVRAHEANET